MVFRITVAFPLSAGRIVISELFLRFLSVALSVLVVISGFGGTFMILTVSCLASSALSTGRNCTAFLTPVSKSSIGTLRGVTA